MPEHQPAADDQSVFNQRLSGRRRLIQSFKAKEKNKRTATDRFADYCTRKAGSNWFLLLNAFVFAAWLAINGGYVSGIEPFDPFPFSFLTTAVSLEAIILAILVLISQNRDAKVADMREEVELQVDIISEEEITKLMQLMVLLLEKHGISVADDKELQSMLKPTNPEKIERAIEKQLA